MAQENEEQTSVTNQQNKMGNDNSNGLDYPPYTIKNIFVGAFLKENMKDFNDAPKTKDFLLPFQDKEQWMKILKAFEVTQPEIDDDRKELGYLSQLFQTLGGHKATKFCNWLNLIRQYGTSGALASMDINQIGQKCKLSKQENAEEIYTTFFNKTLPFIKELILSMPKIFEKSSDDNKEQKSNDKDETSNNNNKYIKLFFQNPGSNSRITLTRGQIASLLACCFFGISIYPHCSFHGELNVMFYSDYPFFFYDSGNHLCSLLLSIVSWYSW